MLAVWRNLAPDTQPSIGIALIAHQDLTPANALEYPRLIRALSITNTLPKMIMVGGGVAREVVVPVKRFHRRGPSGGRQQLGTPTVVVVAQISAKRVQCPVSTQVHHHAQMRQQCLPLVTCIHTLFAVALFIANCMSRTHCAESGGGHPA